ncbi:hypothetical protein L6164_016049 [Bauhinia variegata]|uniref:Uncharacterized protein n=1 Tax=Bauhinia variegata TaxID=167791 RepID=A0ACB9NM74_BAUVA|nr:hypothetical protein L6164_016049 [Bauhinia variegata]
MAATSGEDFLGSNPKSESYIFGTIQKLEGPTTKVAHEPHLGCCFAQNHQHFSTFMLTPLLLFLLAGF